MLSSFLPAPKNSYKKLSEEDEEDEKNHHVKQNEQQHIQIPRYPFRKSVNFVPSDQLAFGDGGAYPEIHCVQYPLNMGKPGVQSTAVVTVQVNNKGEVTYDAIVKQNRSQSQASLVKTSLNDMKEVDVSTLNKAALAMPTKEEEAAVAEKTRLALEALMEGKLKKASASSMTAITAKKTAEELEPTYIRYTPNPDAPGYNPAAKQRVIRMVDAQVDPMEPSKHKNVKTPKGPPSPPVPILHSPPRKLSVEDQQAWKIPPCISNWKNAQGYIIPLDKRLAADGRGLQEVTINNKFASLSEALYVSERKAAEDLRVRNQIRKKMAMREKEDKEAELRDLAMKARLERAGLQSVGEQRGRETEREELDIERHYDQGHEHRATAPPLSVSGPTVGRGRGATLPSWMTEGSGLGDGGGVSGMPTSSSKHDSRRYENDASKHDSRRYENDADDDEEEEDEEDDQVARRQREELRLERRKERERELRLENIKGAGRKAAIDRNEGRDISEKIALGMHTGAGSKLTGDGLYDSRLFNQTAGMDSGFGGDDEYTAYSKPLFDRDAASSIYRPKRDDSDIYGDGDTQLKKITDTSRFKADKGFAGAEGSRGGGDGGRSAPVQFEKARQREEDVFGLGDLTGAPEGSAPKKSRYD